MIAIYVRGTSKQSLEDQITQCISKIRELEIVEDVEVYREVASQGEGHPLLREVTAKVRERGITHLVVLDRSRLFRSRLRNLQFIDLLEQQGAQVIMVDEHDDCSVKTS